MGYPLVNAYSLRHWKWPSRNSWFTQLWHGWIFPWFFVCLPGRVSPVWERIYHHHPPTGDDSKVFSIFFGSERHRINPIQRPVQRHQISFSVHTGGKRYPWALTEQGLEKWVIFHRLAATPPVHMFEYVLMLIRLLETWETFWEL